MKFMNVCDGNRSIWFFITFILIVTGVLGLCGCSRSEASPEKTALEKEIRSNVKIGDNEEALKSFLVKKGWSSSYDPNLGGYVFEVKVGASFLDKHSIVVSFAIKDHHVIEIKLEDFHRSL